MTLSNSTQNMLRLLSQVIIADGHIFSSEVAALVSSVQGLGLTEVSGEILPEVKIRDWFAEYSGELIEVLSQESKEITLTRLILSLADWPDKKSVVYALQKISKADADFHIQEKLLISIVRTYWQYEGLDAPGATIGV